MKKKISSIVWKSIKLLKSNPHYIIKTLLSFKANGINDTIARIHNNFNSNEIIFDKKNSEEIEDFFIFNNIKEETNSNIAIAIHIYYLDKVEEILNYLKNIPFKHTLFFTVCESSQNELVQILKNNKVQNYKIVTVKNFGYDIYPFLTLLPILAEQKFDLVCKVHTKKGAANLENHVKGIDDIWFKTLMNSALGSKSIINQIVSAFDSEKKLGMTGPANLYKSAQKLMYGNEAYITQILTSIDQKIDPATDWGFFAGSIFWARLSIFKPLIQNKKLDALLMHPEDMKTGSFSSIFHAMERVLGKLPELQNLKTGLIYNLDLENNFSAIQILNKGLYFSPIGVGMTLQNEYELEKNYKRLQNNPLFDKSYYLENSLTCKKLNMEPLLHFLRYGVYQNKMPNPNITPFIFWSLNKEYLLNRINPLVALSFKDNHSQSIEDLPKDIKTAMVYVKQSGLFDQKYYLNENLDVQKSSINPLYHYCKLGYKEGRIPSPKFDVMWYETEYLNQSLEKLNPILHYYLIGKKKGFHLKPKFTKKKWSSEKVSTKPKRISLFAAYDPEGIIDETTLIFIKELSKFSDVYFLSDNNLQNSEINKLLPYIKGGWSLRHGEYDFGSYKRLAKYYVGWDTIEKYDELILVNDSSYLISSLEPVFNKMREKNISWWGLQATKGIYATKNKKTNLFKTKIPINKIKKTFLKNYFKEDIFDFLVGSYFLVFRKNIIKDKSFQDFINNISGEKSKKNLILKYEIGLTKLLLSKKYAFDTFMDNLYPFHPIYTDIVYEMIENGFPLFKRFFLTENHYKQKKLHTWKKKLLKIHPNLDLNPIEKNLCRIADASKLYKNLDIEANDVKLISNNKLKNLDKKSVVNKNWWVFPVCAYNHNLDDNVRAIFEEIKNEENIKKIILFRTKHIDVTGKNIELIPLYSRKAQEYLLKSYIIFIKHSPVINIPFNLNYKKHKFINLWHGIPLKRIGAASLDTQNKLNSIINVHNKKCYCTISSSDIDKLAMTASFYPLKYSQVWLTGLPRHDFILKNENDLPQQFQRELAKIKNILNGRIFILYAPTFRNSQTNGYYKFTEKEKESLYSFLEKNNAVLGIREHMADTGNSYSSELIHPQIFNFGNNFFQTIEMLYRKADILITDYSSCFIDFMLTNKPMISFAYDYENYKELERGTYYDLEFVFPGDICTNTQELLTSLNNHFQNNLKTKDPLYNFKKNIFYKFCDYQNSKRVINLVKEITI
jgi:lipopolysaccharide biosynthesis protein/CDP-glycerol glycerophosphotransferase (TagB/SpsB family)